MLTDVGSADKDEEIPRGEDEDKQVRPEKTLCAGKCLESQSLSFHTCRQVLGRAEHPR